MGPLKLHAYLPTYWDGYGTSSMEAAITRVARAAAEMGYSGVWANDKLLIGSAERGQVVASQIVEPLVTLASLVHVVPDLTLGTAVVVLPSRQPVLVAKQAAALHLLSGGRFVLGVGVGNRQLETEAMGVPFDSRGRVADDAIDAIRALWSEPDVVHTSHFHHLNHAAQDPRPGDGGPPIWVGGTSPAAIERVALRGDGWLAFVNPGDPFVRDLEGFRRQVERLGALSTERSSPTVANMFYVRLERADEPAVVRSTTRGMPPAVTGNPTAVGDHLAGYQDAGLDHAILLFESENIDDLLRQMDTFASDIAPRLAT